MAPTRHHVTFRFTLPAALAAHAPPGAWHGAPRGCTLDVGCQGAVLVTSIDGHETYARRQVIETAGAFLLAIDPRLSAFAFEGILSAPSCRERPEVHAVAIGADVSIVRTDPHRTPAALFRGRRPAQLHLLNPDAA